MLTRHRKPLFSATGKAIAVGYSVAGTMSVSFIIAWVALSITALAVMVATGLALAWMLKG